MSLSVPVSALSPDELARLSNFRRDLADALDASLADDGQSETYNASEYGAAGDGSADDSAALRLAIAAASAAGGGIVHLPNGTYIVSRDGSSAYCLAVPANVSLRGASRGGCILKQAAGIAASIRLLYFNGADSGVSDLTLDGNKSSQSVNEQRHGIFADGCTRLRVERVTSQNFTGDGFYLYTSANDSLFLDCRATTNDRNGLTLAGAGQDGVTILGGQYEANAAQQIDSEPAGPTTNVSIVGAFIDPGVSNDYVLTCSGVSATVRSRGWTIAGCTINGPIAATWCDEVVLTGNRGVNASTDKPSLYVYRRCIGVIAQGNHFNTTANAGGDKMAVYITGTDDVTGDQPQRVIIQGNTIKAGYTSSPIGVIVHSAEDVLIVGNTIIGSGAVTGGTGIFIRHALPTWPMRSARVIGNHVKNFGARAVAFAGSGASQILTADVSHNTFDSDTASVQTQGIDFNVDVANAVQQATAIGNNCTGYTVTEIAAYPSNGVVLIGGNHGDRGVYSITNTPEGALTAPVGSMALRRDGGTSTTLYVKESGSSTAGWVAK